jgi:hypothetical protein
MSAAIISQQSPNLSNVYQFNGQHMQLLRPLSRIEPTAASENFLTMCKNYHFGSFEMGVWVVDADSGWLRSSVSAEDDHEMWENLDTALHAAWAARYKEAQWAMQRALRYAKPAVDRQTPGIVENILLKILSQRDAPHDAACLTLTSFLSCLADIAVLFYNVQHVLRMLLRSLSQALSSIDGLDLCRTALRVVNDFHSTQFGPYHKETLHTTLVLARRGIITKSLHTYLQECDELFGRTSWQSRNCLRVFLHEAWFKDDVDAMERYCEEAADRFDRPERELNRRQCSTWMMAKVDLLATKRDLHGLRSFIELVCQPEFSGLEVDDRMLLFIETKRLSRRMHEDEDRQIIDKLDWLSTWMEENLSLDPDCDTDDEESGDEESGDEESGDEESGDEESGDEESGDEESGDEESGENDAPTSESVLTVVPDDLMVSNERGQLERTSDTLHYCPVVQTEDDLNFSYDFDPSDGAVFDGLASELPLPVSVMDNIVPGNESTDGFLCMKDWKGDNDGFPDLASDMDDVLASGLRVQELPDDVPFQADMQADIPLTPYPVDAGWY